MKKSNTLFQTKWQPLPAQRLMLSVSQSVRMEQTLAIERVWTPRLTISDRNPFPLAPKDLVEMGLVTTESYLQQNERFDSSCSITIEKDLIEMHEEPGFDKECLHGTLEVAGAGLGRGLGFIPLANRYGLLTRIIDGSQIALSNAESLVEQMYLHPFLQKMQHLKEWNSYFHSEVLAAWQEDPEAAAATVAIYANQFLQVQSKGRMRKILKEWGRILSGRHRRIWIIHPLPGKNSGPRTWEGHHLPNITWGKTTPYALDEMLAAVQAGSDRQVKAEIIGDDISYFQLTYNCIRFMTEAD